MSVVSRQSNTQPGGRVNASRDGMESRATPSDGHVWAMTFSFLVVVRSCIAEVATI